MRHQRKLFFVVNPHAGKEAVKSYFLKIVDRFVRSGWQPTIYITQQAGELASVVEKQAAEYDLVVCCGGDGTLNETINGLMPLPPAWGFPRI